MEKIDRYSQIFSLHIPKTGGNSFARYLSTFEEVGTVFQIANNEGFLDQLVALNSFRVIHGHQFYPFSAVLRQPLFITTFLRDPLQRVISAFEYIRRKEDHPLHNLMDHQEIDSLSVFCNHIDFQFHVADMQTRMLGLQYDLAAIVSSCHQGTTSAEEAKASIRQYESSPADRPMLERAKLRLDAMPFFGLTELLSDSLRLFGSLSGGPQETSFWENAAPSESRIKRQQTYCDMDLEAVQMVNLYDIELYSFARDLFLTRYESQLGHYPQLYPGDQANVRSPRP